MQRLIPDAILVLHFAVVAYIVSGLVLTWVGAARAWRWVRSPAFRYTHLAAIVFVALEAALGYDCPLTVWEDALRGGLRPESFVGYWVRRLLYYDAPAWVFTVLYVAWATATAITLVLVPTRRKAN